MSVTHRKDGRWMVTYRLNGKPKYEYFGKGPEGEKKAKARDNELKELGIIGQYNRQTTQVDSGLLMELAGAYMEAKEISMTESSWNNLWYSLKGTILPALGNTPAMKITPHVLRQYSAKRLKTPKMKRVGKKGHQKRVPVLDDQGNPKMIKATSVHREVTDIIAILNWAVENEYLPRNPAAGFQKPKRDDEVILPPTPAMVQKLIENAAPHLVRAMVISYFSGLRPGAKELFRIRWSDVNLDDNTLLIISAKKRGKPYRLIPLHPDFKSILQRWWFEDRDKESQHLITWNHRPVASVDTAWETAKRRAGIKRRLRMYDFRHAFATSILKHGGDLKSTSEMLGHSRPDTTVRVYQHTDLGLHQKNVLKIPGISIDQLPENNEENED